MKHSGALLCTACKRVKLFAVPQRNCMIDLRTISFVSIVHFLFRRSAPGPLHWMRNKFSVKNIADGRRSLTHLLEARHIAQRRNLLSHAIQRVTHVGFKKVREEDCALMRASRLSGRRGGPVAFSSEWSLSSSTFRFPPVAGTTRKRLPASRTRARQRNCAITQFPCTSTHITSPARSRACAPLLWIASRAAHMARNSARASLRTHPHHASQVGCPKSGACRLQQRHQRC